MMRTAFGARHSVPTHSVHKQRVLLGLLALLLPATVSLAEWRATYNPYHIDCSAHELRWQAPPSVHRVDLDRNGLVDGTAWEGHRLVFQASGTPADIDCFADQGSYYDEAETSYAAQWRIYRKSGPGDGDWTLVEDNLGTQMSQSAEWSTEDEPTNWSYRAKCFIEDTPIDGPGGDDNFISVTMEFQLVEPSPVAMSPVNGIPAANGDLTVYYTWGSQCGHRPHLDDVAFISATSMGAPVPCFAGYPPNPTVSNLAPADALAVGTVEQVFSAAVPMPQPPPNGPGDYTHTSVQDIMWKHLPDSGYLTPNWAPVIGATGMYINRQLYWVNYPPLGARWKHILSKQGYSATLDPFA